MIEEQIEQQAARVLVRSMLKKFPTSSRNRRIMELRYGMAEDIPLLPMTYKDIAMTFNLSQESIRQITVRFKRMAKEYFHGYRMHKILSEVMGEIEP